MTTPSASASFALTFQKQGAPRADTPGTAIGRKGRKLLISYAISDGSPRERWFSPDRYTLPEGADLDTLPRWKGATCKGGKLDEPIEENDANYELLLALPGTEATQRYDYDAPRNADGELQKRRAVEVWSRPVCEKCGQAHRYTVKNVHVEGASGVSYWRSTVTGWGTIKLDDVLVD